MKSSHSITKDTSNDLDNLLKTWQTAEHILHDHPVDHRRLGIKKIAVFNHNLDNQLDGLMYSRGSIWSVQLGRYCQRACCIDCFIRKKNFYILNIAVHRIEAKNPNEDNDAKNKLGETCKIKNKQTFRNSV